MMSKAFWMPILRRATVTAIETLIPLVAAVETLEMLDYGHAAWIVATATALSVLYNLREELKGNKPEAE